MLCRHVRLLSGLIEYFLNIFFWDVHVAVASATCLQPAPAATHDSVCPPATFLMLRATACLPSCFVLFIVVAVATVATVAGGAAATVIYTCCLFYANLMQHSHSLAHSLALRHCRKEKKTNEPGFD